MANKKIGAQTVVFERRPYLIGRGNIGGKKEGASEEEGYFGYIFNSSNTGGMKKITKKTGISISATDVVKVSKTNPGSNYEKYNEKSYYLRNL